MDTWAKPCPGSRQRTPLRIASVLALLWGASVHAATDTLPEAALRSTVDSVRAAGIRSLLGKPVFAKFLLSLHDGDVHVTGSGKLVVSGEEDWSTGSAVVPLEDPVTGAPLSKDGAPWTISVDSLSDLPIGREDRALLETASAGQALSDPDPVARRKAVESFLPDGAAAVLPDLREALAKEKNRSVREILAYAVAVGELDAPSDSAKIAAAHRLVGLGNASAVPLLRAKATVASADVSKAFLFEASNLEGRIKMLEKVQVLFSGLSLGSILVLVALGLSIIYGLAGVINMAHGEFLMVGAYTTYAVQVLFDKWRPDGDLFFWVAMPFSILTAGCVGMLINWAVLRHLHKRPLESLLATWGVSLIMVQAARSIFGDLTSVRQPAIFTGGYELAASVTLPWNRLFIIVLAAAALGVLAFLLYRTRFGLRLRAVVQNRDMSACLGVRTASVDRMAFFLGGGLAGLAGWAMTLVGNVVPNMGESYIVDSFLVVVTGGVGKLLGTVIAGMGIGLVTKGLEPIFESVYGKVILLGLIILFLQVRPTGIFAPRGRGEDA
jgi:urea transport system permease protein